MYRELIVRKFYPRREKSKEKKLPKQMKIYLKKVRSPSSFAISRSAYIDPLLSPCGSSFSLFFLSSTSFLWRSKTMLKHLHIFIADERAGRRKGDN